jgi:hypothetical protein
MADLRFASIGRGSGSDGAHHRKAGRVLSRGERGLSAARRPKDAAQPYRRSHGSRLTGLSNDYGRGAGTAADHRSEMNGTHRR